MQSYKVVPKNSLFFEPFLSLSGDNHKKCSGSKTSIKRPFSSNKFAVTDTSNRFAVAKGYIHGISTIRTKVVFNFNDTFFRLIVRRNRPFHEKRLFLFCQNFIRWILLILYLYSNLKNSSHDRFRPCLRDSSDGIVQIHHKRIMQTVSTPINRRVTVLIVLATIIRTSSHDRFRPCLRDSSDGLSLIRFKESSRNHLHCYKKFSSEEPKLIEIN